MAARNQKNKRAQKQRKRRKQRLTNPRVAELLCRVKQQEFFQGRDILIEPDGVEKMSAVILDFASPYLVKSTSDEMSRNIITFAILAWNLAIYKERGMDEAFQRIHDEVLSSYSEEKGRQQFHNFLAQFLQRKQEYFAEHKSFILEYDISFPSDNIHLDVVSFARFKDYDDGSSTSDSGSNASSDLNAQPSIASELTQVATTQTKE